MSAQIIQFPRKAQPVSAPLNETLRSSRAQRATIQDLIVSIGRGHALSHSGQTTVQVRNFLLVRYRVQSIQDIPPESLPEVIGILHDMRDAVAMLEREWRELKKRFDHECLGAGVAWVPWIKRKMRSLKEELPERPDWSALATRVGVARRDEP